MAINRIKRALFSVTDKEGIELLAKELIADGCEIISSGGTGAYLSKFDIPWTPVERVTGNPEAFGGRMKTLSFQILSGLLYRRDSDSDNKEAKELGIKSIDLVVCNLYPFVEAYNNDVEIDSLVENIDIGGPSMIRAAAKNYKYVSVLTDKSSYKEFLDEYLEKKEISLELRSKLALKAFQYTASYEAAIAGGLNEHLSGSSLNKTFHLNLSMGKELRYGENPSQWARVIKDPLSFKKTGIAGATPIHGKQLSYNNLLDADAAFRTCSDLNSLFSERKVAVIIKHANPCGAAVSNSLFDSLEKAWGSDKVSSFGSIICFNAEVDKETASFIRERFVEIVIAPKFTDDALSILKEKKNLRLIELSPQELTDKEVMIKSISGGWVVQNEDTKQDLELDVVTENKKIASSIDLIRFGIIVTKFLKSNAISLVSIEDDAFVLAGAGMGNPNRLVSVEQACAKAAENSFMLGECVLISDAFFPFRDNIELLSKLGVTQVVQPGGSIKDQDIIEACDEQGISMCFTGQRHFRH